MPPIQVEGSSNIKSIDYIPNLSSSTGELRVEFVQGGVYAFTGVETSVWDDFRDSLSKGKFFAANIKGKYEF